jgi:CBS domain-containing protein
MRCSDIMKAEPECLDSKETVRDAAARMRDANIGFLPVCDADQKVLGTITDRDIAVRVVADGLPLDTAVAQVMTREAITCPASEDVERVKMLMQQHRKSRIMLIDDYGRLAGIISLSDIARTGDASGTLRAVAEREARA